MTVEDIDNKKVVNKDEKKEALVIFQIHNGYDLSWLV